MKVCKCILKMHAHANLFELNRYIKSIDMNMNQYIKSVNSYMIKNRICIQFHF